MDYLWGGLDPSDKGYYKAELTEFKANLDKVNRGTHTTFNPSSANF